MGLPGLISQYQPQIISDAAKYIYMIGWLLTFITAAVIYHITAVFVKPQIFPSSFENIPLKREWLANDTREGFLDREKDFGEIYRPSTPPTNDGEEVAMGEKSREAGF